MERRAENHAACHGLISVSHWELHAAWLDRVGGERHISIYKSVSHFSPQRQLGKWLVRGSEEKCQVGADLQGSTGTLCGSKWSGERKELRNLWISLGNGEGTLCNLGIWVLYLGSALCSGFEQLTPTLCLLPCLWSKTMLYIWWKPHWGWIKIFHLMAGVGISKHLKIYPVKAWTYLPSCLVCVKNGSLSRPFYVQQSLPNQEIFPKWTIIHLWIHLLMYPHLRSALLGMGKNSQCKWDVCKLSFSL